MGNPKPGTLNNIEARWWYLEKEVKIPSLIDKNETLEQQARQAFDLRNQFRTQARDLMSGWELANTLKKEEPNLTWNQVVQKAKDKGYTGDDIFKYINDRVRKGLELV